MVVPQISRAGQASRSAIRSAVQADSPNPHSAAAPAAMPAIGQSQRSRAVSEGTSNPGIELAVGADGGGAAAPELADVAAGRTRGSRDDMTMLPNPGATNAFLECVGWAEPCRAERRDQTWNGRLGGRMSGEPIVPHRDSSPLLAAMMSRLATWAVAIVVCMAGEADEGAQISPRSWSPCSVQLSSAGSSVAAISVVAAPCTSAYLNASRAPPVMPSNSAAIRIRATPVRRGFDLKLAVLSVSAGTRTTPDGAKGAYLHLC